MQKLTRRIILLLIIAMVAGADFLWPGRSPNGIYPVSGIKIYVPFKPGGATDSTARTLADAILRELGIRTVVINQTSGGTSVAINSVIQAKPDGETFLLHHAMLHVSQQTGHLPFDSSDLTPIMTICRSSDVYVARSEAPYSNLKEALEYSARADQKELLISSQQGGTTQLKAAAVVQAARRKGGDIRSVAVGGMSKRLIELLGKRVDIGIVDASTAKEHVESGALKVLGVISDRRDPIVPDWPTSLEQGVNIDLSQVGTLYAPPNMPAALTRQLSRIFSKVMASEKTQSDLREKRQEPEYRNLEETRRFLLQEAWKVKRILEEGT